MGQENCLEILFRKLDGAVPSPRCGMASRVSGWVLKGNLLGKLTRGKHCCDHYPFPEHVTKDISKNLLQKQPPKHCIVVRRKTFQGKDLVTCVRVLGFSYTTML